MESHRTSINLFDGTRDGAQKDQPLLGRTSGPTRRSTKGHWTPEEDEALRMAVQCFKGKNWKKIAECLKDRTDVQCLHRWQKVLNPDLVKGSWSKEEDVKMIEFVQRYGPKKWSTIAQHLPGRIGKQCRERWHNHLNPNINKEAWSQDEELTLIRAHETYGNKWAELTKFLPGRTDNAIKNHWHSSLKKKLDTCLASGSLSRFQGPPLVSHLNHAAASSSSNAQLSGIDDIVVTDEAEEEEASECSRTSTIASLSQYSKIAFPCSEDYHTANHEITCSISEVPCEQGNGNLENDSNLEWQLFAGESSGASVMRSNFQMPEDGNVDSEYCYMASETLRTSFTDTHSLPVPAQLYWDDSSLMLSVDIDNYINSTYEIKCQESTSIYANESNCGFREDNFNEAMGSEKLVSANEYILEQKNNPRFGSPKGKNLVEKDEQKDSRALFYKPPSFTSLDIPFFSCDFIQSGNDIHQEFSPLSIHRLMISPIAPLKLWDSPSRDDCSPNAFLKNCGKDFAGTPTMLKKRRRSLVSPLSEKRCEKKLESALKQDTILNLTNEISQLEVLFNDCVDQGEHISLSPRRNRNTEDPDTEKENVDPAYKQEQNEIDETVAISESRMSSNVKSKERSNDAVETVDEFSGVLLEHDMNDLVYLSPDRFGIKSGEATVGDQYHRKLDAVLEHGAVLSSAETSPFSIACSQQLCTKKGGINLVITTSLKSPSSTETKVQISGNGVAFEKNIFVETPIKRSIDSPYAWKSPWFIEDIGYFLSPRHQYYDATGLMKRSGEHTACAFSNTKELSSDINKGKCIINQEAENRNNRSPNPQMQRQILSASKLTKQGRALDFKEFGTPRKGTGKSPSTNYPSPSSYLLKSCR